MIVFWWVAVRLQKINYLQTIKHCSISLIIIRILKKKKKKLSNLRILISHATISWSRVGAKYFRDEAFSWPSNILYFFLISLSLLGRVRREIAESVIDYNDCIYYGKILVQSLGTTVLEDTTFAHTEFGAIVNLCVWPRAIYFQYDSSCCKCFSFNCISLVLLGRIEWASLQHLL